MKPPKCLNHLVLLLVAIFAMGPVARAEWKEGVLYSFQGGTDGATPAGGLVFDTAGNLYGATTNGGSSSCHSIAQCGTVFQLVPPAKQGDPWTETVLYVFKGNASNDGASPAGGVVIDAAGNLYGTTAYGGTGDCVLLGSKLGCGTVYELSPPKQKGGAWTETVLYSFPTAKQGYLPNGDLVFDRAGNLYGATEFGGGHGTTCNSLYQYCGAVFELSPPKNKGGKWTEKVLHGFAGGTDGANPNGGSVLNSSGAIYGTTQFGGFDCPHNSGQGCGTAFQLSPPAKKVGEWKEKILYRFKGSDDCKIPNGGLVLDAKGLLYGTAVGGGHPSGDGAVFELRPPLKTGQPWAETLLHTFVDGGDPNGALPMAGLTVDQHGVLYGTASGGGAAGDGTVFGLRASYAGERMWSFFLVHTFTGPPDAEFPAAALVFDRAGSLYGTTQIGGSGQACRPGCGTVFKVAR